MQIAIEFEAEKDIRLPIHYNSILQGFIYNNIDDELASFLHDNGYELKGRRFKLFTFSRILTKGRKEGTSLNFGRQISLAIASPIEFFIKSISEKLLFSQGLRIGQNMVKARSIEVIENGQDLDSILVSSLSPIVAYSTFIKPDGRKYTNYYKASDDEFTRIVRENIFKKYELIYGKEAEDKNFKIDLVGQEMMNIVYYRKTVIRGVSGKFFLEGNKDLIKVAIDTGLGSKNSQGFGMITRSER